MLVLLGAPVRSQQERQYKELPGFHRVNDMVYRGAQPKSGGLELLRRLGIKTVINLRDNDARAKQEEVGALNAGLQYFNLPFERWGRPRHQDIEKVLSIINNPANHPVFVHCRRSRSNRMVIAVYRITNDGWTSEQAMSEAKLYGLKPWQLGMKGLHTRLHKRKTSSVQNRER